MIPKISNLRVVLYHWFRLILINLMLFLRPFFGMRCCRYTITCTQYAEHQLHTQPFWLALWKIIKRILSCQPLSMPNLSRFKF
jgi:putative component of membrane protein insertase Oxa1/YidC/SpoIIIJ protein YidD